jgi:hypothetical protein
MGNVPTILDHLNVDVTLDMLEMDLFAQVCNLNGHIFW